MILKHIGLATLAATLLGTGAAYAESNISNTDPSATSSASLLRDSIEPYNGGWQYGGAQARAQVRPDAYAPARTRGKKH